MLVSIGVRGTWPHQVIVIPKFSRYEQFGWYKITQGLDDNLLQLELCFEVHLAIFRRVFFFLSWRDPHLFKLQVINLGVIWLNAWMFYQSFNHLFFSYMWQLQQHCSCNQVPTISYNNKHVAANLSSEFSVSYGCNACLILTVLVKMQPQN